MIEIKITGENAKEAVNELRALSVEFGGQTVAPQAQYPTDPPPEREPPQVVQSEPAPVKSDNPDDELDITQPDAEGYPWDERIHSGNQKQTANGVWQKRRGVDDATIAKVKAELDGEQEAAPAPAPAPEQAEQSAPAPQPEQSSAPAPAEQTATPPAPAPEQSSAPAPAESLQLKLTKALQALNNHTPGSAGPKLVEVLKKHGANTINAVPEEKQPELAAMLDKITKDPSNVDSIMEGLA